jgi:hypothetical protein
MNIKSKFTALVPDLHFNSGAWLAELTKLPVLPVNQLGLRIPLLRK